MGAEHRKYVGEFQPDPLRQTGESQDSFASPVSADYDVNELYAEFSVPLLETLDVSAAVRWSDYSTFGDETTGKFGLRWQPIEALAFRGTYLDRLPRAEPRRVVRSHAIRRDAGRSLRPHGHGGGVRRAMVSNTTPLETACRAQGVPSRLRTGQHADHHLHRRQRRTCSPRIRTATRSGIVHNATWAESFRSALTFELTYFSHEIDSGIQARDIQALINACLAAGGTDATLCSPFTRQAGGNLDPPNNFLDNLGTIETDGFDFKIDWRGTELSWGTLSVGLQSTFVNDYTATDTDGIVSQRTVGIEVSDSAIPELQANMQIGWEKGAWEVSFLTRYIDSVDEFCGNALTTQRAGLQCTTRSSTRSIPRIYNDVQVGWNKAFGVENFKLALSVNNIFGEDPPICYSCSLNGYDAGTYDLPGTFWAVTAKFGF